MCRLIIKHRSHKRKESSQGSLNTKKMFETLYNPMYTYEPVISQPPKVYFPLCLRDVWCKVVLVTVNVPSHQWVVLSLILGSSVATPEFSAVTYNGSESDFTRKLLCYLLIKSHQVSIPFYLLHSLSNINKS